MEVYILISSGEVYQSRNVEESVKGIFKSYENALKKFAEIRIKEWEDSKNLYFDKDELLTDEVEKILIENDWQIIMREVE